MMLAEDRHRAILDKVRARGSVKVRDLAEELGVAAVTIRVDVRELARRGLVTRVHGAVTRAEHADRARDGVRARETPEVEPTSPARRRSAGPDATYTLGMVVPHPQYYYPDVVSGAREAAAALDMRLVLGVSRNDQAEERAQVDQMLSSGVDGLLLTTSLDPRRSPGTEKWLRELPVPVVLAERRVGLETGSVEHVATDHEYGAYLALRHLAALGHERVGLLQLDTITAPMLQAGYDTGRPALALQSCPPRLTRTVTENDSAELDARAKELLGAIRSGEVDALIIHNDSLALPIVGRLRAAGVAVPGELAVVAYDDQLAALSDPPLTAVAPPRRAVGAEAIDLLVRRLDEPDRPLHHLLIRPELRPRQSC